MENIFIPTKNRVENSTLLKFAEQQKQEVFIVVEPQEYKSYKNTFPNFKYIILPENNGGITYVRNYIKEYSEKNEMDNYWQLDDDITGFFYREGTKLIKDDFSVLSKAAEQFKSNSISLGGLEYRQFAWSASKDFVLDSFCDSCVFVDNTKTKGLRYRKYLEGKEDRDFAMQVISLGGKTARTTLYAFSAPANGSNAGGLKEIFYDIGKEEIAVSRMVEVWGKNICVPIVKPSGRNDIKIMWKKINSNQLEIF
ncbi:hypothetical protein P12024L_27 [Nonlabens phage P12024L]|uniref:TET-Associated Glycosyltransferase domain-containing protein n=1 Tax=Nonlabens phage P12024L TaxID=1168479 RepID=I6S2I2_9CAUD|nr:beta-glucosyl-HMC-alpha-glucosyltransferase [Nonlabens phage P12024L]AFM54747.1 hypothetical protein P12024L_27 [Nonlabens phage P12024L]